MMLDNIVCKYIVLTKNTFMPLWIEGETKEEKTKKKLQVSGVPICLLHLKRKEKNGIKSDDKSCSRELLLPIFSYFKHTYMWHSLFFRKIIQYDKISELMKFPGNYFNANHDIYSSYLI